MQILQYNFNLRFINAKLGYNDGIIFSSVKREIDLIIFDSPSYGHFQVFKSILYNQDILNTNFLQFGNCYITCLCPTLPKRFYKSIFKTLYTAIQDMF